MPYCTTLKIYSLDLYYHPLLQTPFWLYYKTLNRLDISDP